MNTYSCRFECSHDYTLFVVAASKRDVLVETSELYHVRIEKKGYHLPDIHVEFMCSANKETLLEIMRNETDLHVGLQTLRQVPLKENSLERDHTIV